MAFKASIFDEPEGAAPSKFKPSLFDAAEPNPEAAPAPTAAPAKAGPSAGQSAAVGASQGATLGFGDEAAGAVDTFASRHPTLRGIAQAVGLYPNVPDEALDPSLTYAQRRDAYRQQAHEAQAAHPVAYGAGEIAGGIVAPVPGVKVSGGTGLGSKVVNTAATGGLIGGIAGAGYSEADTASQVAKDAIRGAGLGAGIGGALPVAGAAVRVAAGGGKALVGDIIKGAKKAPAKLANDVKFRSGEGGENLRAVLDEVPEARKAIVTQAKTNPAAAASTVEKVVRNATDANDEAFAAIQRQHGGVPLTPILERLDGVAERLRLQGRAVSARAVKRVRSFWEKEFGQGDPEAKLSAQQLRNIRNDLGDVMDPARTIKPNTKRHAESKIYGVLNKEIDDVAAETRGLDLKAFKSRNRQISTLIPVSKALRARAESEAERSLMQKAKAIPGNMIRGGIRRIGYAEPVPAAAVVPAVGSPADRRLDALGVPVLASEGGQ